MAEHAEQTTDEMPAAHESNALDPKEIFSHVEDSTSLHVPKRLTADRTGHIEIPQPFKSFKITRFMAIELVIALLLCVFFIGLAKALCGGAIPRGRFRNMLEAMLLYFRDHVASPASATTMRTNSCRFCGRSFSSCCPATYSA